MSHQKMIEILSNYYTTLGNIPYFALLRTDNLTACKSPSQHDAFNYVISNSDVPYAEIKQVLDFFDDMPFSWQCPDTASTLLQELLANGAKQEPLVPGMHMPLKQLECPNLPNITISKVKSSEECQLWINTAKEAFEFKGPYFNHFVEGIYENTSTDMQFFIAYLNQKPVGVSFIYYDLPDVSIYYVATKKEARKRGIGKLLTTYPLSIAQENGATNAYLESTAHSHSLYQKIGFKQIALFHELIFG